MSKGEIAKVVEFGFGIIKDNLQHGENMMISGFGK